MNICNSCHTTPCCCGHHHFGSYYDPQHILKHHPYYYTEHKHQQQGKCDNRKHLLLANFPTFIKPVKPVVVDPCKPIVTTCVPSKVNHCPSNKVKSISRIGSKLIITMNDCTFYETDLGNFDLSTFNTTDTIVTKVDVNKDDNSITVTYYNSKLGTYSPITLKLPPELHIVSGSVTGTTLNLSHNDGSIINIDLDKFKTTVINDLKNYIDTNINNIAGSVINNLTGSVIVSTELVGNIYTITLKNGTKFETNLASLISADKYVNSGAILSGKDLILTFNDNSTIKIDLTPLVTSSATVLITGGNINGTDLILNLSNGTSITVDITSLITDAVKTVTNNISTTVIDNATNHIINNILNLGYRINTQVGNYTLVQADFDGRTMVRAAVNGDQVITVSKPVDEKSIGTAVIIRKTAGAIGTFTTLVPAAGVTLSPIDSAILRRVGSSVTLVYIGNGAWDIFGELP